MTTASPFLYEITLDEEDHLHTSINMSVFGSGGEARGVEGVCFHSPSLAWLAGANAGISEPFYSPPHAVFFLQPRTESVVGCCYSTVYTSTVSQGRRRASTVW